MVVLTEEMKIALGVMDRAGIRFHATRERELDCGCIVYGGWVVRKMEPGLSVKPCTPAHRAAFDRARARWTDPDIVARFDDVEGYLSMATLMEEEIARG